MCCRRRLTVAKSLSLVAATLALTACAENRDGGSPPAKEADLSTDRTFVAKSVSWGEGRDPIERVVVRIEDEQVRLKAGCNELSTDGASVEGGALLVDSLIGTDMGCTGPVQDQDEWLGDLLGSEPRITIDSDTFELRSDEAALRAETSPPIPR